MEISKAIKRRDLFNFFSANCLISLRKKCQANSNLNDRVEHSPKNTCPKWWQPRTHLKQIFGSPKALHGTKWVVFKDCFLVSCSYCSIPKECPFLWSVSYFFLTEKKVTSSKGTIPQSNKWDHPDNQIISLGNGLRKWANNLTEHKQIISDCYKECY